MPLTTERKLQIARLLGRGLRGARSLVGLSNTNLVSARDGLNWQLDLNEGIDLAIYLGAFEKSTTKAIERLAKPGQTVLDIGANIGAHTLRLAQAVGSNGHVYAFEPTDWAYQKLLINIGLNPSLSARVTATQAMLVAREGQPLEGAIYSSWPLTGDSEVHALHQGALRSTSRASAITVDRFLAERAIKRVDLVKLDVDGFECDVIEGWSLLKDYRPTIIMELAPYVLAEHGRTLEELLALLTSAGYALETETGLALPEPGPSLQALIPDGAGINVVAKAQG
jgi:FkbM family methyltransferase